MFSQNEFLFNVEVGRKSGKILRDLRKILNFSRDRCMVHFDQWPSEFK
jgi:hypothetical protein